MRVASQMTSSCDRDAGEKDKRPRIGHVSVQVKLLLLAETYMELLTLWAGEAEGSVSVLGLSWPRLWQEGQEVLGQGQGPGQAPGPGRGR